MIDYGKGMPEKKLKVYLDTSIINFLYVDDSPVFRKATEDFFDDIVAKNKIEPYVSSSVIDEIKGTRDKVHRYTLLGTFEKYPNIQNLTAGNAAREEIALLSEKYIENNIIPKKNVIDSFHIAFATVFQMDILLSWNFKHLANINKEQKVIILNKTLGYHYPFRMANPLEVYYGE
jgi:rRNA-processing protein FCF1